MARVDQARRVIVASPEQVFAAFLDEDALRVWLPPEGMTAKIEHFDDRPGGGYRMTLTYKNDAGQGKSSADADTVNVGFLEIEPEHRIVQVAQFETSDEEFQGQMTMTWTFTPAAEGTEVLVTAENVPPGILPEDHKAGLESSLQNLAAYVEQQAAK